MSLLRNPAENPSNQRCPGLTAKPKVRLGDRGEFCYIIGKEFHKKKIPLSKHTRTQACASTHVHTHTKEKPTFNTEFPFLSQGLIFASSNKETARRGRGWKAKSSEGRETQAAAPCEAPGNLRLLSLFLEPFRPQTCWADQGQHSDETVQTCVELPSSSTLQPRSPLPSPVFRRGENPLLYVGGIGVPSRTKVCAAQASQGSTLPQQGSPHSLPCQAPAQESLCKVKSLQVVGGFHLQQRA